MQLKDIEAGDIVFFTPEQPPHKFALRQIRYQYVLSIFFCKCRKLDYKKTHVAICTEKVNDDTIKIAHIAIRSTGK